MLSLLPHMTLHIPLELTQWSLPPSLGLISIIQRKQFVDEQLMKAGMADPNIVGKYQYTLLSALQ